MRVLHIHTDPKFLLLNSVFLNGMFINHIIFLSEFQQDLSQRYPQYDIDYQPLTPEGLRHTVEFANSMDLVIVYMLDTPKSYICNRINKSVKVIWRFFGAELYGKIGHMMYSELTKSAMSQNTVSIFDRFKYAYHMIYLYGFRYRTEFNRAMLRSNAIAMLYKQEYEYLSEFFRLPAFVQIPYESFSCFRSQGGQTKETIILGNSRNRYNNHLDILELLKKVPNNGYTFVIPFNYGEESNYTNRVRETLKQMTNVHIINEFMPLIEYNQLFKQAAAFVFNAYRQMAMANIFMAICNDVKVYLSPKNTAYAWLLSEDFIVFNIKNLTEDIKNNNVCLKSDEVEKNRKAFESLLSKYSNEDFENKVRIIFADKNRRNP